MKKTMNVGLEVSRNFDKVILTIVDEEIEYEDTEELKSKIRNIYSVLQEEVDIQFSVLNGKK